MYHFSLKKKKVANLSLISTLLKFNTLNLKAYSAYTNNQFRLAIIYLTLLIGKMITHKKANDS